MTQGLTTFGAAPRQGRNPALWLLLTPVTAALFLLPGGGWGFALAAPLTLWPSFASAIRRERDGEAFRLAVLWAILLSATVIAFTLAARDTAASSIVRGESYRTEMFAWIETGVGKEGDWRLFLPEHGLHLAVFALLALVSGGYLALALGAALLAYMNYFVASVMLASGEWGRGGQWGHALTTAWFPWSISRVLAFIALGVLLARPLLARSRFPFERRHGKWVVLVILGLALDVALKIALAPIFRDGLAALLGFEVASPSR